MNRGLEIAADAADAARSLILDQVSAGVAVRMSVLYHLLAGDGSAEPAGRPGSRAAPSRPCTKECHEHRDDPAGQGGRPRRSGRRGPAGARRCRGRGGLGLHRRDAEVIDADGLVALPGLVDLHTHLREPGREDAETIATGAAAAAVGGYTAILAMANTTPVTDTAEAAERIAELGARTGLVDVQPIGAVTKGLAGEELAELGLDGPVARPGCGSSPTTATASTTRG